MLQRSGDTHHALFRLAVEKDISRNAIAGVNSFVCEVNCFCERKHTVLLSTLYSGVTDILARQRCYTYINDITVSEHYTTRRGDEMKAMKADIAAQQSVARTSSGLSAVWVDWGCLKGL